MTAGLVGMQGRTESQHQPEVGDLLISYLEQIGVKYVFGVPGGAIEPLYNALARSERNDGVKAVVARHETGAAFMAEGYSRNSGKLGACCSTTGPGATNLITGVASAYENQTPLLVVTAQTALRHMGKRAFQESADTGINVVGMMQFCTHYNSLVSHVDQFEQKLVSAVMKAFGNPCGPVHLSIPVDVLRSRSISAAPSHDLNKLLKAPMLQDEAAIKRLGDEIEHARKVVFVLGAGCKDAASDIMAIAASIGAHVVTTPDGKGIVSPYHPLFRGVIGFAGHKSAERLLVDPEVDLVVAVGALFGEWNSNGWDSAALFNDRLVHVEQVEINLLLTPMAKLHVLGRISSIFSVVRDRVLTWSNHVTGLVINDETRQHLHAQSVEREKIEQVQHFELDEMRKYFDDSTPLKPQWLMHKLAQLFPPNTKYVADTGNSVAWAIHYLHPFDRRITERRNDHRRCGGRRSSRSGVFQCSLEFASMGWAIGNAVGIALAKPEQPVVCITGDGSVLMSGQEMTVAQQMGLPVIFIILNDSSLGMVKHGQRLAGAEPIGVDLPNVDFSKFAQSMGVSAYRVRAPHDLLDLDFAALCSRNGPTVLDVLIDQSELPPLQTRVKILAGSIYDE